jgi:hypothetical protein
MKIPRYIAGATLIAGVFVFLPSFSFAQVVQTTDRSTQVYGESNNLPFYVGTTTNTMTVSRVSVWLGDETPDSGSTQVRFTCFANQVNNSQAGCTNTAAITSSNSYDVSAVSGGQRYDYVFSGGGASLQNGKVYVLEIITSGGGVSVYGAPVVAFTNQCNYAGSGNTCTGAPYFVINAGIQWDLIQFPLVYSSSSAAIATSSGLWDSISFASSTVNCDSGNIFSDGICSAAVYLFVPNPDILNQYSELASTTIPDKFPFSWVFDVKNSITGASATSSMGTTTFSFNLHDIGIGSSTSMGNFLPNFTVFSEQTVKTYIAPSIWSAFQALIAAALWLVLAFDIYATIRRRHQHV